MVTVAHFLRRSITCHVLAQRIWRLETGLTARTIAASVENADMSRIIGLAGGLSKAEAIRAVLKSGRLYGLITDERTAKVLLL